MIHALVLLGFAKGIRARNQLNLERSREKEERSNNGQVRKTPRHELIGVTTASIVMDKTLRDRHAHDRHGQDPPRSPWTRPSEITMDKTQRDHHGQDPTRSPWTRLNEITMDPTHRSPTTTTTTTQRSPWTQPNHHSQLTLAIGLFHHKVQTLAIDLFRHHC
ncbi:hypothetical protein B0O80DRAFT_457438 [Mortierella sp. GBAus27b]|nr:hypothetical protein B0O80DRAFT_457438 [Mortierella sp. GBAus27b]